MSDKLKELAHHVGKLRDFFLSNKAEAPLEIVLSDRNALSFMRSITRPWNDINWVKKQATHFCGVKISFRPPDGITMQGYPATSRMDQFGIVSVFFDPNGDRHRISFYDHEGRDMHEIVPLEVAKWFTER